MQNDTLYLGSNLISKVPLLTMMTLILCPLLYSVIFLSTYCRSGTVQSALHELFLILTITLLPSLHR